MIGDSLGRDNKLEQYPEAAELALKMKMRGAGLREIADAINQNYPEIGGISHMEVQSYVNGAVYKDVQLLEHADAQTKQEALKHILDISGQLEYINKETLKIAQDATKPADKLRAFDAIMRQLAFSAQLAGQVKQGTQNLTKIDIMQLTTNLPKILKQLEDKGYIVIKKPMAEGETMIR